MPAADLSAELEAHRGYLLRVARLQLRDEALAEDVVQETLLAALSGSGFSGKSTLKTWLTGILKHKIVDAIRRKRREPVASAEFGDLDAELDIEDFDAHVQGERCVGRAAGGLGRSGGGAQPPAVPRHRWISASQKLPPNTARAFMMREVMELETDEICKELAITANNLWVILYRARMALRQCLEQNWFAQRTVGA